MNKPRIFKVRVCEKANHIEFRRIDCKMIPRLCPHCQVTLPNMEMVDHIDRKCPNLIIECPFRPFGCSAAVTRQVVEFHFFFPLSEIFKDLEGHLNSFVSDHLKVKCFNISKWRFSFLISMNIFQLIANSSRSSLEALRTEMISQLKLRDEKIQELEKMLITKVYENS